MQAISSLILPPSGRLSSQGPEILMSGSPSDLVLRQLLTEFAQNSENWLATVETGKIFHSEGLRVSGKYFAFIRNGELVLKLPADRVTELIAHNNGKVFDAGRGRPMKEWIIWAPSSDVDLRNIVAEAGKFVAAIASSTT